MDSTGRCESHFGTNVTVACKFLSWFLCKLSLQALLGVSVCRETWQCSFYGVRSLYLEKWMRKSPIVLALWSNLVTCLGLSEIKGVSLLLCSVGTYTCCYFCQLLSKMSSASINSCKSNIHYAAIVSLFIFFRFQPFSINVLHSMYSTNTHTHTRSHSVEFWAVWFTKH